VTKFLRTRGASLAPMLSVVAYPAEVLSGVHRSNDWVPLRKHRRSPRGRAERIFDGLRALLPHSPRPAAFIFSDLERLDDSERERAAALWTRLDERGIARGLLNHPLRALRRYALLRRLEEQGINDFGVYRSDESRRPRRYPVFLRGENDHAGSLSGLLHTPDELSRALQTLEPSDGGRRDLIITEFSASRDERGLYRKYSAWCIDGRILPGHLFFGPDWMLKRPTTLDAALVEEELAFLARNPHAAELARVFALAGIEYGRADYGIAEGRIQVYEINTNPGIPSGYTPRSPSLRDEVDRRFNQTLLEAFRALAASAARA
jgi:hypothetical protein